MGVWECGCYVKSNNRAIQSSQVEDSLASCGFKFTRQNPYIQEHSEFVYEDEFHILEALTAMPCIDDGVPFLSISLRFAICNPESAVVVLVDKATKLAKLLNGYVVDDYHNQYEGQNAAENDLLITSLSTDYSNRSRFSKEDLRVHYPIAKRTVTDFVRDLSAIRKRRLSAS